MATDGPYRLGNHNRIHVYYDPDRDYATSQEICTAIGGVQWAQRIVEALNAQEAEPVVDSELRDRIAQYLHTAQCDIISDGPWDCGKSETHWQDWREVADIVMGAVAPVLADRDAATEQIRIKLADALKLSHSYEMDTLLAQVPELMRAFMASATELVKVRAELARERESREAWQAKLAEAEGLAWANFEGIKRQLAEMIDADEERPIPELLERVKAELDLRWATRQQYAEERDKALAARDEMGRQHKECHGQRDQAWRVVEMLSWLHAEAVWQRDVAYADLRIRSGALADALGVARNPVDYFGWVERVSEMRAELEQWRKGPLVQPVTGATEQAPHCWCARPSCSGCTPATSTEPRAVYHEPGDVQYEHDEDDNPVDPSVGWDIAFGCRVSFGIVDGVWRVDVAVSDAEKRDGGSIRSVTRQQIRAFAYQLIRLTEVGVVEDQAGGRQ